MCYHMRIYSRSIRNSPLCWLTWHGELRPAAFLVNAGWRLHDERWLSLPGKTDDIERFLATARMLSASPDTLRGLCRGAIRNHLRFVLDDRDIVPSIMQLPLPPLVHRYLTLDSEYDLLYWICSLPSVVLWPGREVSCLNFELPGSGRFLTIFFWSENLHPKLKIWWWRPPFWENL